MKVLGVDEAGRGCVIGPLVLCGVLVEDGSLETLKELGVKDSKQLRPSARERLSEEIRSLSDRVFTRAITPEEIDSGNINHLELHATVEAIRNTRPDVVYIDVDEQNCDQTYP